VQVCGYQNGRRKSFNSDFSGQEWTDGKLSGKARPLAALRREGDKKARDEAWARWKMLLKQLP
jgi:hypothetical protein